MKKTILLLTAVALSWGAAAQDRIWEFAAHIGVNLSYASMDVSMDHNSTDPLVGFSAGATVNYNFSERLYMESGLFVKSKGTGMKFTNPTATVGGPARSANYKYTYTPTYLQVPLAMGFRFPFGVGDNALFVSGGGYVAYGVGGDFKEDIRYQQIQGASDLPNENTKHDAFSSYALQRFDCGLRASAGVEWNWFVATVSCDWGLIDISRSQRPWASEEFKNRSFALTVGHKF